MSGRTVLASRPQANTPRATAVSAARVPTIRESSGRAATAASVGSRYVKVAELLATAGTAAAANTAVAIADPTVNTERVRWRTGGGRGRMGAMMLVRAVRTLRRPTAAEGKRNSTAEP